MVHRFRCASKNIVNHSNKKYQPIRTQYLQDDQSECFISPFHTPGVTENLNWLCCLWWRCVSLVAWFVVCCFVVCGWANVLWCFLVVVLVRFVACIHTALYPVFFCAFFLVLLRILHTCFLYLFSLYFSML